MLIQQKLHDCSRTEMVMKDLYINVSKKRWIHLSTSYQPNSPYEDSIPYRTMYGETIKSNKDALLGEGQEKEKPFPVLIPLTKKFAWKTPRDNYWLHFRISLVWHYSLHIHIMELRYTIIVFHRIDVGMHSFGGAREQNLWRVLSNLMEDGLYKQYSLMATNLQPLCI